MVAELLKYGVVLPAAIAAVCGLSLWVRSMTPGVGRLIAAAGVGLGWLGGIFLLGLVPFLPEAGHPWDWLPALAVLAIIGGRMPEVLPVRLMTAAVLAGITAYTLIPTTSELRHRTQLQILLGPSPCFQALLDRPMKTTGGRFSTLLLASIAGAAGAVLEISGNGTFAQMAGAWRRRSSGFRSRPIGQGVVAGYLPLVALLLPSIVMTGWLNSSSQVPIASYVMVGLSPLILASPLPAKETHGGAGRRDSPAARHGGRIGVSRRADRLAGDGGDDERLRSIGVICSTGSRQSESLRAIGQAERQGSRWCYFQLLVESIP